jgi:suppressor of G2 allele of SKP1
MNLILCVSAVLSAGPPCYPSSSKKAKDWDKVALEDDKPEGEAALNALFQQIYSEGSDEVKKAMNKSFVSTCRPIHICRHYGT